MSALGLKEGRVECFVADAKVYSVAHRTEELQWRRRNDPS